jgi:glycosyltransferase involved in cell wall biosynthesis
VRPLRILWVKLGGLWPIDAGGRLRSYHIVGELSRRHRVSVLTTHPPGQDATAALAARLPHVEVVSTPFALPSRGTGRFALALARAWLARRPVEAARSRVPALRRHVERRLAGGGVDVCVADFLVATPSVPLGGAVPVVLFAHNVEHLIWRRLAEVEPRRWRRAALALEARRLRRWEGEACARAALTAAVSELDRERLAALAPRARLRVVPTGVDTAYFAPGGGRRVPGRLVFVGSMDWHPNEDAVLHFLAATLPRIRRARPGVSVAVVGRNPRPSLRAAAVAAGVTVTGTVDDVRPWLAEAEVCIVPLRVGGGTRLKIFEALAMGRPVVSTRVGAEGLPIAPGRHYLQADTPEAFAAAVVTLLREPGRARALAEAGRRLVTERYSWAGVARAFEAVCREAVEDVCA